MPAEIAVNTTGHVLVGMSAFYQYTDCSRALMMPGAIKLSGFPPPEWGRVKEGPKAPNFRGLLLFNVTRETIDKFIDFVFSVNSASPQSFHQGGALRHGLEAAAAALVMYFPERYVAGREQVEAKNVNAKLLQGMIVVGYPANEAINNLKSWASTIMAQFASKNVHLTSLANDDNLGARKLMEVP